MTQKTINLERRILVLFKLAYQQGRSDVAEHLLRALEALDQRSAGSGLPAGQHILFGAYDELIRR